MFLLHTLKLNPNLKADVMKQQANDGNQTSSAGADLDPSIVDYNGPFFDSFLQGEDSVSLDNQIYKLEIHVTHGNNRWVLPSLHRPLLLPGLESGRLVPLSTPKTQ